MPWAWPLPLSCPAALHLPEAGGADFLITHLALRFYLALSPFFLGSVFTASMAKTILLVDAA